MNVFALLTDSTLTAPMEEFTAKFTELIDSLWVWFISLGAVLIVLWGAYIGVKYIIAQRNEQKVEARDMVKQLAIGIPLIVAIALGAPALIAALGAWIG